MMPQMDSGDSVRERQEPTYGRYEGNQQPGGEWNAHDPSPQNPMYDDTFVDAFAQRLSQRMAQGPQGKLQSSAKSSKVSAGQRLALAIVSVIAVTMMTMLILTDPISNGTGGWIALGGAYLCVFLINGVCADKT